MLRNIYPARVVLIEFCCVYFLGSSSDARTTELLNTVRRFYIPGLVIAHFDKDDTAKTTLQKTVDYTMIGGEPTVYLCHNQICELPITGVEKLVEQLSTSYLFNLK